jgi:hypothetical protein
MYDKVKRETNHETWLRHKSEREEWMPKATELGQMLTEEQKQRYTAERKEWGFINSIHKKSTSDPFKRDER